MSFPHVDQEGCNLSFSSSTGNHALSMVVIAIEAIPVGVAVATAVACGLGGYITYIITKEIGVQLQQLSQVIRDVKETTVVIKEIVTTDGVQDLFKSIAAPAPPSSPDRYRVCDVLNMLGTIRDSLGTIKTIMESPSVATIIAKIPDKQAEEVPARSRGTSRQVSLCVDPDSPVVEKPKQSLCDCLSERFHEAEEQLDSAMLQMYASSSEETAAARDWSPQDINSVVQLCGEHIKHISTIVKNADEIASKASHIVTHMPTTLERINSITATFKPDALLGMFYRLMAASVVTIAAINIVT